MGAPLLFASPLLPGLTSASPQGQVQSAAQWKLGACKGAERANPALSGDCVRRSCDSGRERLREPLGPCLKAPLCEEPRTPGGFTVRPGEQGDGGADCRRRPPAGSADWTRLPTRGTWLAWLLVWEGRTCPGTRKPEGHNRWARAATAEARTQNPWATAREATEGEPRAARLVTCTRRN